MNNTNVTKDVWLSNLIGKDCFTVQESFVSSPKFHLIPNSFYQSKLKIQNVFGINELLKKGFKVISHDVTFSLDIKEFIKSESINNGFTIHFEKRDKKKAKQICALAEEAFAFDRFHLDDEIPKIVSNQIKREWVYNFFNGKRGDYLLVASKEQEIYGFLLLIIDDKNAIIDLIAVNKTQRGNGIGRELISCTLKNIPKGVSNIIVGTQLENISSVALYKAIGFKPINNTVNLHLHS